MVLPGLLSPVPGSLTSGRTREITGAAVDDKPYRTKFVSLDRLTPGWRKAGGHIFFVFVVAALFGVASLGYAEPPVPSLGSSSHGRVPKLSGHLLPVLLPDLVVEAVTVSPSAAKTGQMVRFTATVKNQGKVASPAAHVDFRFSPVGYGEASLPPLQPGQSTDRSVTYTFVSSGGHIPLTVTADDRGEVRELSEGNNSRSASFYMQCRPELAAYNIIELNTPLMIYGHPNQTTTIVLPVKNYGCASAGPFLVTFGCPGMWPSGDQVAGLDAGQTIQVKFQYVFHENKTYECSAVVDSGNNVDEAFENNNGRAVKVNIAPPWPGLNVK